VTATDIYRALWRRRFLILFLTAMTVATAYVLVSRETKMYNSSALVRVQQRVADPTQVGQAIGVAQHLAQTYAHIVTTDNIADKVFASLHGKVPRQNIHLSAKPVEDLELLYISATSPVPAQSAAVANAAPVVLRKFIDAQPPALRDEIEVVNKAGVSTAPSSPDVKLAVIIAFLGGLIFNSCLALALEFLSDRLREPDELEAATGVPVLATVPALIFRSPVVGRLEERLAAPRETARVSPPQPEARRTRG
jgi:capsular polysaccharide biosynthesis protein